MKHEYIDVDLKAWERSLSKLGRQALPKVAATALTDIAFKAQAETKAEMIKDFDRPTAFTLRAFRVDRAKPTGGNTFSRLYAQEVQSRYLAYTVFGGVRRAGDPGAGRWDVPVPGPDGRLSPAGGVPRGYAPKLHEDKTVFFARLFGIKGYWKRPKRKGRTNLGSPKLLLQFRDEVKAPITFKLSLAISGATIDSGKKFYERLASEIRKLRG